MWLPGTVRRLGAGMVLLLAGGCLLPSDRSADLRLVIDPVQTMYAGDTVQIAVRTADPSAAGAVHPEDIQFESSDPAILEVAPSGRAVAHHGGIVTVTASVRFADAAPSRVEVTILSLLSVDSVVPGTVRFGDTLRVYGVGLNPTLTNPSVGGLAAPVVDYQRTIAASAGGPGVLTILTPTASPVSYVTVSRLSGGSVSGPVPVTVIQQDWLEPNDAAPRSLGTVSSVLAWRALALEGSPAGAPVGRDWYTFVNPTYQSVTLTLRPARPTSVDELSLLVTDTLDANAGALPRGWAAEVGANYCRGTVIRGFRGTLDSQIIDLYRLEAGTYHVLVASHALSPTPREYDLRIEPGYHSVLPPDAEEYGYRCVDPAIGEAMEEPHINNLLIPEGRTITNPGAVDWFRMPTTSRHGDTLVFGDKPVYASLSAMDGVLGTTMEIVTEDGTYVAGGLSTSGTGPAELVFCPDPTTNYLVAVTDMLGVASRYHLHFALLNSTCPLTVPSPEGRR